MNSQVDINSRIFAWISTIWPLIRRFQNWRRAPILFRRTFVQQSQRGLLAMQMPPRIVEAYHLILTRFTCKRHRQLMERTEERNSTSGLSGELKMENFQLSDQFSSANYIELQSSILYGKRKDFRNERYLSVYSPPLSLSLPLGKWIFNAIPRRRGDRQQLQTALTLSTSEIFTARINPDSVSRDLIGIYVFSVIRRRNVRPRNCQSEITGVRREINWRTGSLDWWWQNAVSEYAAYYGGSVAKKVSTRISKSLLY